MKAVCIEKPWSVGVKDVDRVEPNYEESVIKVHAAGICGSDIGAFRGTNNIVSYPRIIGHEIAGEVISVGTKNPNNIKVGDRVVIDPYTYCGHCYPCSLGKTNCCRNIKVRGVHIDGGMCEYFTHYTDMLVKIPDGLDWEKAALAEPLTIALHAIHRLNLKKGEHIVVFGAGTIGLLVAMASLAYEAIPIIVDIVDERLELAKSIGVKYTINPKRDNTEQKVAELTHDAYAECVCEASGASASIRASFDVVCHAGRVAFTGYPKGETTLPTDIITKKELDVLGTRNSRGDFPEALELIASKKVDVEKIITKVVPVEEAPETLRDIEKNPGNYLKVVVKF